MAHFSLFLIQIFMDLLLNSDSKEVMKTLNFLCSLFPIFKKYQGQEYFWLFKGNFCNYVKWHNSAYHAICVCSSTSLENCNVVHRAKIGKIGFTF